jgi:ketosteroid isomerase-like protein
MVIDSPMVLHRPLEPTYLEETRQVISGYLAGHEGNWMAETIEFHDMTQPAPYRGCAAAEAWLHRFYVDAFADAKPSELRFVAGDGLAAAEWIFRGRHIGSLMGEPPSGREVAIPMAAAYDVEGGEITRARLYSDGAAAAHQMGTRSGEGS